jgi:hypothetical protein
MRVRLTGLLIAIVLITGGSAWAQSQTGEIFGKVTDESGAVLPGVTVTITGPVLLQPLTAITSDTGTFQFPRLDVGTYTVKFELPGFKTVVKEDIRVTVGFNANVSTQLGVSTVQETVTVTGESPIVDTKETGTKQTFTLESLQNIPSARDPWVILQQTAGIAMDRENIGGNMSGQQSNYISRGGNTTNNKWALDGVDITDMSATGASPSYYDFDAFQEMTINTGGVDVTQQTGGVGINLVTKSGSDRFRGSGRFYRTNDKFESNNITDDQRRQGASSGNPIQDIQDYGFEAGGPIKRGRAWAWGSFGKQDIDVGVINFFQPTATCQQIKSDLAADPLSHSISDTNDCLNTDNTLLQTTNLKAEVQLFKGNKLSLFNNFAKKVRNARGADDLHPIETTQRQSAVKSSFGQWGWITGPNPTYKFGDQWVVSDRLLLDVQYAHVGNNFILDFHEDPLSDVQPTLIVSTGLNGRSASQSVFLRPVNSLNFNSNYFMPSSFWGDHAFKIGGYWRDAFSESIGHTGGNAVVRFPTALTNDCSLAATGCNVNLTRDSHTVYRLTNISVYGQDTLTHGRLTLQLGVRYDRNHEKALAASVPANPLAPDWLPAATFGGTDTGVVFNNFSPRLGFTYDLSGRGKTLVHANGARYYGQVGTGNLASQINPLTAVTARYPWVDANGDKVAQANEVMVSNKPLAFSGNWDPLNPTAVGTANTIDPNIKNDTTDEFIVGADHEIGRGVAVGANYIWRRYGDFQFTDTLGLEPSDFRAVQATPTCTVSGARCETVTYYEPVFQLPTVTRLTNFTNDQYRRTFNGFELTGRKRMANHWMVNSSFTYNSTIVHNGFAGTFANTGTGLIQEDPTNRAQRDGFQYDYLTAGSGLGNVYVNAKWLFKLSGQYQAPYSINVSAFYNARQGYPFEAVIRQGSRQNGLGQIDILLDPVGENRLPNYQNLDLHIERPIIFGSTHFVPSLDIFNVTNNNTVQAVRGVQNASNANFIQAIVAPRVIRFGIRVNW